MGRVYDSLNGSRHYGIRRECRVIKGKPRSGGHVRALNGGKMHELNAMVE